jgi:hypothetical protein
VCRASVRAYPSRHPGPCAAIGPVPCAAVGPKQIMGVWLPQLKHFPTRVVSPTHLPVANMPHSRPHRQLSPRCPLTAASSATPSACHARNTPSTGPSLSRPSLSRPILRRAPPQSRVAPRLYLALLGRPCRIPVHICCRRYCVHRATRRRSPAIALDVPIT